MNVDGSMMNTRIFKVTHLRLLSDLFWGFLWPWIDAWKGHFEEPGNGKSANHKPRDESIKKNGIKPWQVGFCLAGGLPKNGIIPWLVSPFAT